MAENTPSACFGMELWPTSISTSRCRQCARVKARASSAYGSPAAGGRPEFSFACPRCGVRTPDGENATVTPSLGMLICNSGGNLRATLYLSCNRRCCTCTATQPAWGGVYPPTQADRVFHADTCTAELFGQGTTEMVLSTPFLRGRGGSLYVRYSQCAGRILYDNADLEPVPSDHKVNHAGCATPL